MGGFLSFQSACIRFITFLSLRLVDAPRVQLHWYGRGEAQAVTMTSFLVHYLHTQSPPGGLGGGGETECTEEKRFHRLSPNM